VDQELGAGQGAGHSHEKWYRKMGQINFHYRKSVPDFQDGKKRTYSEVFKMAQL
jgi:hypothetical protein